MDINRRIRSATKRFFIVAEGQGSKRDFMHSDKSYACVLPGTPEVVIICEGGISGLAAQENAHRNGYSPPTVIVTGGVKVLSWIGNDKSPADSALRCATRVVIQGENERDATIQFATDKARQQLVERLTKLRLKATLTIEMPPPDYGDIADMITASVTS
jgi:hypothetical protein